MKKFFVLAIFLATSTAFFDKKIYGIEVNGQDNSTSVSSPSDAVFDGTYQTRLDHFSPRDGRLLQLKYQGNKQYFEKNGPIFVNINVGDGFKRLHSGLVYDLAKEIKGALIQVNNRYFGSNKWGDHTLDNLKYLTVDHLLSDIPYLVEQVKRDLDSKDSRVVLFGTFGSGALAALARKRFPHMIDGAWSSSGVFRAVTTDTTYFDAAAKILHKSGSSNCTNAIADAFRQIQQMVSAGNEERLQALFNVCSTSTLNLNNPQNVQLFYGMLIGSIPSTINTLYLPGVQSICNTVTRGNESLDLFATWFRSQYSETNCINPSYEASIKTLRDPKNGNRALYYYFCTQLGLPFAVTNENSFENTFPNVIHRSYYDQLCRDTFDDAYNFTALERATENFNIQHGSQHQIISNVIFTEGGLSPYVSQKVIGYDSKISELIVTPSIGSAGNLDSISENDPSDLTETKEAVVAALKRFVTSS